MDAQQPRVIGLDLSLTGTGIATTGHTVTAQGRGLRGLERLREICAAVDMWACYDGLADLAVIEGPAYSRSLGSGHHEAAGLWWMVADDLARAKIPMAVVPPTVLKKYATGKGNATKADMRMALFQRADIDLRDDDQVDAWWLRAIGLDHLGHPIVTLPQSHRQALQKVSWPQPPTPAGDASE